MPPAVSILSDLAAAAPFILLTAACMTSSSKARQDVLDCWLHGLKPYLF
ncbi:hypothetical protein IM774_10730 [Erysipelotrichaceae bacterium RD49]|nr:hypothetical protein [Erysipelotrichaceae bacterium RD49]